MDLSSTTEGIYTKRKRKAILMDIELFIKKKMMQKWN